MAAALACACAASRLRLALRGSVSDELESCVKRGTAAKKKEAVGQSEAAHKAAGGSAADGAAKSDGEADAAGGLPRERSLPSRAFAAHVSLLALRPRLVVLLHAVAVAAVVALTAVGYAGVQRSALLTRVGTFPMCSIPAWIFSRRGSRPLRKKE